MSYDHVFIEATGFTRALKTYFGNDEGYAELQNFLLQQPEAGAVIPGAGPLRKLLWKDPRRGKSKRGGLRVMFMLDL